MSQADGRCTVVQSGSCPAYCSKPFMSCLLFKACRLEDHRAFEGPYVPRSPDPRTDDENTGGSGRG